MLKIIHVSDLHIGKSDEGDRAVAEMLDAVWARGVGTEPNKHLLVTGDIVDDGEPEQYQTARGLLERFARNITLCPGNHDFARDGTFERCPGAEHRFEALCEALHAPSGFVGRHAVISSLTEGRTSVNLIGLNSTFLEGPTVTRAWGRIGPHQLQSLTDDLDIYNYGPTVVYLHHRPEGCEGLSGPAGRALLDKDEFLAAVLHRVDVVAFGHDSADPRPQDGQPVPKRGKRTWMSNADSCLAASHYWCEIGVEGTDVTVAYHLWRNR